MYIIPFIYNNNNHLECVLKSYTLRPQKQVASLKPKRRQSHLYPLNVSCFSPIYLLQAGRQTRCTHKPNYWQSEEILNYMLTKLFTQPCNTINCLDQRVHFTRQEILCCTKYLQWFRSGKILHICPCKPINDFKFGSASMKPCSGINIPADNKPNNPASQCREPHTPSCFLFFLNTGPPRILKGTLGNKPK